MVEEGEREIKDDGKKQWLVCDDGGGGMWYSMCVRERKREHIYILIQLCRVPNNIEAHSLLLYEQKH